jgi:phosphonate transport system substrate-binding protein
MLAKINETPEGYFKNFIYTYSHDNSIKAVANKEVDGASVDSLIYDYVKAVNPKSYISATKIIAKSEGFGIPPFAGSPGLDPALKAKLKDVLLNMHKDEEGKKILDGIKIECFGEAEDSLYDSVRDMQEWLEKGNR